MSEPTRHWMIAAALLSVTGIGATVGATEMETIFDRLIRLESVESGEESRAARLQSEMASADAELETRWALVDVALRAAKPIRHEVNHVFATWLVAQRAARRGMVDGPAAPEDTRRLLQYGAPRALPARLRDVDVIRRADAERDAFSSLVRRRGQVTVQFAVAQATGQVAATGRRDLVATARDGGADTDLESTERLLAERLAEIDISSPSFDFHRLKGTLARPVTMEPAYRFGETGPLVRSDGVTYRPEAGREIYSTGPGRVVLAEHVQGWGFAVVVDHGADYRSIYGHLSDVAVKVGDDVDRADVIAAAGESGSLDGVRTYYELRRDGEPVDPVPWFLKR